MRKRKPQTESNLTKPHKHPISPLRDDFARRTAENGAGAKSLQARTEAETGQGCVEGGKARSLMHRYPKKSILGQLCANAGRLAKAENRALAYYNEIDPYAAAWLRELIEMGEIPAGFVDERDIQDVVPNELTGFTQYHFFAGAGGWPAALRLAGWPDDKPVITASAPCQPFSEAGAGAGFDDERHLWPAFYWLLPFLGAKPLFGEQVTGGDGAKWLDAVHDDLEAIGFAVGAVDLPAAGAGAPQRRQRFFFVASPNGSLVRGEPSTGELPVLREGQRPDGGDGGDVAGAVRSGRRKGRAESGQRPIAGSGVPGGELANSESLGHERGGLARGRGQGSANDGVAVGDVGGAELPERRPFDQACGLVQRKDGDASGPEGPGGFAGSGEAGADRWDVGGSGGEGLSICQWRELRGERRREKRGAVTEPSATNGFWSGADWIACRDSRVRPIESGSFPLVDGIQKGVGRGRDQGAPLDETATLNTAEARIMRLAGYGNAIVVPLAAMFVRAAVEALDELNF